MVRKHCLVILRGDNLFVKTVILFTLSTLVSACGSAATSIPSTATLVPSPMKAQTVVPPTVAPTPARADRQAINAESAAQLGPAVVFDQPGSFVHTVVFSPDSRYLITADLNGYFVIREVEMWEEHARFITQADISSASLSPDGTVIVTGGAAGNIMALDLAGNELFSIPYSGAVFCTKFSPDGRYLAESNNKHQVVL